ncbi:MAG TPA: DegV family protein [Anaerolineales bacterium]
MTIRLVTDSTCDLPQEAVKDHNITVIPLIITADSAEMRDGVDITRDEFYARLPGFRHSPKTAAPGPSVFRWNYERLASEGASDILSIHISEKLSATIENARQAAADTRAANVIAFDSRQLSLGTGYEVLAAAQAAEAGRSVPEILDLLDGQIRRTHVCAALDTLEYMRRGGRMNGAITALGNLLQVKPILKMYDGQPTADRVRTRRGALKRLRELIAQHAPYERAAILHSGAADSAREFMTHIEDLLPRGDIWMEEINPVLGAHIGPGVIGFAGVSAE